MITPQQWKQRWEAVPDDRLVAFPETSLSDVRIPADARAFLVEAGLPAEAAPFLDFGPPKTGALERVSIVYDLPPAFDRYRIIGGNGSGDPVCLDEDDQAQGEVVYLNHDNSFKRVLMGSSVLSLAECLLELRDLVANAGGDTEQVKPEDYAQLLARFRTIDPAASGKGSFWEQELRSFLPEKPWWKLLTRKLW